MIEWSSTVPPVIPLGTAFDVLEPPAELDLHTVAAFWELAHAALDASPWLVLDMQNVVFLDSSALAALVSLRNRAVASGGDVVLQGLGSRAKRVMEITQLDRVFTMRQTRECLTLPTSP